MKDHVEIGHLTEYDAFMVNRDQVMDFKIWFKIHANVFNFEKRPPKPYKHNMGSHISQKWYEITTGDPEIDRYG